MKATDLMIGDWVHSSFFGVPVRIKSINFKDGYGWVNTTLVPDTKSDASLSPIPLTPEILEKNGWEKKGSPYEWKNNIWVQRWNLPINTGSFQILDCPNYDGFTWNNIELNFVHTLQHALRLCGLDDLADGFKI